MNNSLLSIDNYGIFHYNNHEEIKEVLDETKMVNLLA
jgi:hypothetical protein